jgi:hypothetical protein
MCTGILEEKQRLVFTVDFQDFAYRCKMRIGDTQLGLPEVAYKDTQSNIEALANPEAGMLAYATDIDYLGWYSGSLWMWYSAGSGGMLSRFRVDYTSNWGPPNNTWTKFPIDSTLYDTASEVDLANNRVVLANDCDLVLWCQCTTRYSNGNGNSVRLYLNGAMQTWYGYHRVNIANNQSMWSAVWNLPGKSANDYIEYYAWKWNYGNYYGNQHWIQCWGGFTLEPS